MCCYKGMQYRKVTILRFPTTISNACQIYTRTFTRTSFFGQGIRKIGCKILREDTTTKSLASLGQMNIHEITYKSTILYNHLQKCLHKAHWTFSVPWYACAGECLRCVQEFCISWYSKFLFKSRELHVPCDSIKEQSRCSDIIRHIKTNQ